MLIREICLPPTDIFYTPSPLFVEIFNKRPGCLFEALQYEISFQIPKNEQIKKILKNLVMSLGKY